jgi:hypothetical protein
MNTSSPLVRVSVRNGLIGGVLGFIMLIVLYYIRPLHPLLLVNPLLDIRIFVFPIFIFFTLKEYKARFSDSILYFWQGMIASYIFLIVYGIVCAVGISIFAAVVPEFSTDYTKQSIELLKNNPDFIKKIGEEEFERNFTEAAPTNGLRLGFFYFLTTLAFGFFMSLVLTVIMRKTNQP